MFIILASNSNHQVQAFGTPTGKTFQTESAAERTKRKLEKQNSPGIDWLVLPICDADVES